MKRLEQIGLDFEVDKLTNSIENIVTGDSFATDISIISITDLKNITKKNGWQFDWKLEFKLHVNLHFRGGMKVMFPFSPKHN